MPADSPENLRFTPEQELAAIVDMCQSAGFAINDGEMAIDVVARVVQCAWPEDAATIWFKNWQACARAMTAAGLKRPPIVTPVRRPV